MRTPDNHPDQPEPELQAPPKLVAALKGLPRERPFVPPTVDEAIARAAQRHLAPQPPRRLGLPLLLRWLVASGAGAALLLCVYLVLSTVRSPRRANPDAQVATAQAPQGPVDILDALRLAKRLQAGSVDNPAWDVNGDGHIDERDVQAIAAQAVRLDKGGRS